MTSPQARKGRHAELAAHRYIALETGWHVVDPKQGQRDDVGDMHIFTPELVVVQVKNYPNDLARAIHDGLAELPVQIGNAGAEDGFVLARKRGITDPGDWIVARTLRAELERLRER